MLPPCVNRPAFLIALYKVFQTLDSFAGHIFSNGCEALDNPVLEVSLPNKSDRLEELFHRPFIVKRPGHEPPSKRR